MHTDTVGYRDFLVMFLGCKCKDYVYFHGADGEEVISQLDRCGGIIKVSQNATVFPIYSSELLLTRNL